MRLDTKSCRINSCLGPVAARRRGERLLPSAAFCSAAVCSTVCRAVELRSVRRHARGFSGTACLRARCHAAAFRCATAACVRAFLAMSHLMLGAFFAAGFAHICANIANRGSEFASARHIAGGHAADLSAVHIELDAARHHFYIVLCQACRCAVIACGCARIALVDTGLELFMSHGNLLSIYGEIRRHRAPAESRGKQALFPGSRCDDTQRICHHAT
jgi:hypothetical protein